jgi:hypothetical protein
MLNEGHRLIPLLIPVKSRWIMPLSGFFVSTDFFPQKYGFSNQE